MIRNRPLPVASALVSLALVAGLGIAHGQSPPPWTPLISKGDLTIDLVPVVTQGELTSPVRATHAGDGSGRLFIVDQPGQIRVVTADGTLLDMPFLDLAATGDVVEVNPGFDERGLLGLAFHPNYEENGRFFVRYSKARPGDESEPCFDTSRGCHESILAEFRVSDSDPNVADPTSQRIVFRIDQPEFNHNGGDVNFGPAGERCSQGHTHGNGHDPGHSHGNGFGPCHSHGNSDGDDDDDDDDAGGLLYFSLGDGGGGNDGFRVDPPVHGPDGNGLNRQTNLGAVLRIDVDGELPYAIPPDNPFAGGGCDDGCDEIYAYGMRNPYRFSFDREDGRLFLGDVGQALYEEVDIVRKGGNYGWVEIEGFHCMNRFDASNPPSTCSSTGLYGEPLLNPIAEYSHQDGLSVIGGFVYRGSQRKLQGKYIFGDFSRSFVPGDGRLFWLDADGALGDVFEFNVNSPSDPLMRYVFGFGEDEDGEVYVLTSQNLSPDTSTTTGEVFRIVAVEDARFHRMSHDDVEDEFGGDEDDLVHDIKLKR